MEARMELLVDGGVRDPRLREVIAEASTGVPFYLHLAVDSESRGGAVSQDEIMQRFLQHVDPDERRYLDLLSVARTFDFELFTRLAQAFHLPASRLAWERLIAYSFVYPTMDGRFHLHQLMAAVLRARLSPAIGSDAHGVLHTLWTERAAEGGGVAGPLREAAYHGLRAGLVSSDDLLAYADRITALGGSQGMTGLIADLNEYLDDHFDAALEQTARCLAAESAVLLGDAEKINDLTPDDSLSMATSAGARLAVAAGHGRRIAGKTSEALGIYTNVWENRQGPERHPAGLWSADLHMAQGRFKTASHLAKELSDTCPSDAYALKGDIARLLHLGARFTYDFQQADQYLREAELRYQQAETIVGTALVATNRAELLAWIDPFSALKAAREAIEVNTDLGALHEVGKAYTALAQAQLTVGRLEEAQASLKEACQTLEKVGYRSGRARAELVKAALYARLNQIDDAAASAHWAIDELLKVEVYPTLLIIATHLLDAIERSDGRTAQIANDARARIEAMDSIEILEARMKHHLRGLLT